MTLNPLKWLGALAHFLEKLISASGRAAKQVETVILPVLQEVGSLDIHGNRIQLAQEIWDTISKLNLPWLQQAGMTMDHLLGMNKWDFKLWLATAKAAGTIADQLGLGAIPAVSVLRGIIDALYPLTQAAPKK